MIWFTITLGVASFVATYLLAPSVPGSEPWWERLTRDDWATWWDDKWVRFACSVFVLLAWGLIT